MPLPRRRRRRPHPPPPRHGPRGGCSISLSSSRRARRSFVASTAPRLALPDIDPVPTLLARVRAELRNDFAAGKPIRVSRAPGRLDVMGGIADYTGSMVCQMPLDRAVAVALQERDDRDVQVFSFNLF